MRLIGTPISTRRNWRTSSIRARWIPRTAKASQTVRRSRWRIDRLGVAPAALDRDRPAVGVARGALGEERDDARDLIRRPGAAPPVRRQPAGANRLRAPHTLGKL